MTEQNAETKGICDSKIVIYSLCLKSLLEHYQLGFQATGMGIRGNTLSRPGVKSRLRK